MPWKNHVHLAHDPRAAAGVVAVERKVLHVAAVLLDVLAGIDQHTAGTGRRVE